MIDVEIFVTDDRAQELIDCAAKLNCLGGVIETLAECDDKETLSWHGSRLGSIIKEYSQALEFALSESYTALNQGIKETK